VMVRTEVPCQVRSRIFTLRNARSLPESLPRRRNFHHQCCLESGGILIITVNLGRLNDTPRRTAAPCLRVRRQKLKKCVFLVTNRSTGRRNWVRDTIKTVQSTRQKRSATTNCNCVLSDIRRRLGPAHRDTSHTISPASILEPSTTRHERRRQPCRLGPRARSLSCTLRGH